MLVEVDNREPDALPKLLGEGGLPRPARSHDRNSLHPCIIAAET
jgi:hypothetical protein